MSEHVVFCRLVAKPGKELALQDALAAVCEASKQEAGCREYRVLRDIEVPQACMLYEIWDSKEEHAKQFGRSYIIAFGDFLKDQDILAEPWCCVFAQQI